MPDVSQNIILRVGSSFGPGGMASLQASVQMLGQITKAMGNVVKENEKFAQSLARLELDISKADKATDGLVDTLALIEQANKLQQAGIRVTADEYKVMAARAVTLAQATGKDATEAFKALTNGIAKGGTRLQEYGVKIKTTTDVTHDAEVAIKALVKGHEDLTAEAETTTERMFQLENNVGTFTGQLWSAIGASESGKDTFDIFNDTLGAMNEELAAAPQAFLQYNLSLDAMVEGIMGAGVAIIESLLGPLIKFEEFMGFQGGTTKQFVDDIKSEFDRLASIRREAFNDAKAAEIAAGGGLGGGVLGSGKGLSGGGTTRRSGGGVLGSGKGLSGGGTTRRSGGGRGGRKRKSSGSAFGDSEFHRGGSTGPSDTDILGPDPDFDENAERIGEIFAGDRTDNEEMLLRVEELRDQAAESEKDRHAQRMFRSEQLMDTEAILEEMRLESEIRRSEESIERSFMLEESISFAERWGEAWTKSFRGMTAGGTAASGVMGILKDTTSEAIKSAIHLEKMSGAAIKKIIHDKAEAVAIESGFMAIVEFARAIGSFASQDYGAGVQHLTSAGLWVAAAAAAGVVAGVTAPSSNGASASASGSAGSASSDRGATSGVDGGGGGGGTDRQTVEINVTMRDDAGAAMFDMVSGENDRRSQGGSESFSRAEN